MSHNRDIYIKNDIYTSKATDILSEIQKANKPVIFFGGVFSNNFAPMFDALNKKGYTPFYILRTSGLAMTLKRVDEVYNNVFIVNFDEMLELALNFPKNSKIFINWDSFRVNNFAGFRAACTMVYVIALLKMINEAQTLLLLYDPVSLIYKEYEYSEDIINLLGGMLKYADKIVYNSSTFEMLDFQANLYNLNKPMINFYRYNNMLDMDMP